MSAEASNGRKFGGLILALDQGVVSAINVGVLILWARSSDIYDTGVVALCLTTLSFVGLGTKAFFGDSTLISRHDMGPGNASKAMLTCFTVGGVVIGFVMGLVAALLVSPVAGLLLGVGAAAGQVQDALRYRQMLASNYVGVLRLDSSWLAISCLGWTVSFGEDGTFVLLSWAAGSVIAVAMGVRRGEIADGQLNLGAYWSRVWVAGRALLLDVLISRGSAQASYYLLVGIVGLAATAGLRLADTVLGPINVLLQGAQTFLLAELAQDRRPVRELPLAKPLVVFAVAGSSGVIFTLALQWVPESAMRSVIGPAADSVMAALMPLAVSKLLAAVGMGAVVALKVAGHANAIATGRSVAGVLTVASVAALAIPLGVPEAIWGLALGSASMSAFAWAAVAYYRTAETRAEALRTTSAGKADGAQLADT
ncbi:hypothetical protein [Modestobacter sp. SYSU DS0657]